MVQNRRVGDNLESYHPYTYFENIFQQVDLCNPRFAISWLSKTSRNPGRAHWHCNASAWPWS